MGLEVKHIRKTEVDGKPSLSFDDPKVLQCVDLFSSLVLHLTLSNPIQTQYKPLSEPLGKGYDRGLIWELIVANLS